MVRRVLRRPPRLRVHPGLEDQVMARDKAALIVCCGVLVCVLVWAELSPRATLLISACFYTVGRRIVASVRGPR